MGLELSRRFLFSQFFGVDMVLRRFFSERCHLFVLVNGLNEGSIIAETPYTRLQAQVAGRLLAVLIH